MSGKLIVIEGTDGTGKETQTRTLIDKLRDSNVEVRTMSFPRYKKHWGSLIREDYLSGRNKEVYENDPWLPSNLYALDRRDASQRIRRLLDSGAHIILDRFTESNLAYQGAKLSGNERSGFIKRLTYYESQILGIPSADHVLYLDLPLEETVKIIKERVEEAKARGEDYKDIHEQDIEFRKRVRETYLELAAARDNWIVIDCMKSPDVRLTREEVADLIWANIYPLLK